MEAGADLSGPPPFEPIPENAMPSLEQKVVVLPFSRQTEGEEVVIGRLETGQFLALPPDAVEILDDLAAGATVGEAQRRYQERHGELPDLEEFLLHLESRGFVRCHDPAAEPSVAAAPPQAAPSYHFTGISQLWARRLFSRPVLGMAAVVIGLALLAVASAPSIVPGPRALYFSSLFGLALIGLILWNFAALYLHEMAHLVGARSVGVPARLAISHRLWVLVAETDLTGLWSVPRRDRYLPLLAGPLLDVFSLSALLLVFYAQQSGWVVLGAGMLHVLQAGAFGYILRLLWQCFLFVRTDFYYALITRLGCVNLMRNTEIFLRNRLARLLPGLRQRPEEALPPSEARAVRLYVPLYLAGRLLAFWSLFFITLPVMWLYGKSIAAALTTGYGKDPSAFLNGLLLSSMALVSTLAGLFLWIRSLLQRRSAPT
jgi:putative peptide zinc metalloprotease protein